MTRYNPFQLIHKGLRAMLYDAALSLQQTYFADVESAENALQKVEAVLRQFEGHAHHEDTFIMPAIEKYDVKLAEEFEKEHVEDNALGSRLKTLVNIFRSCELPAERLEAGSAIARAFVEFMVFNLEHMAKEEMLLNAALWEHYADEEIIGIQQRLVASIPKEELASGSKWMLRGINNMEVSAWLKEVQNSAPPVLFAALVGLAKTELPIARFEQIEKLLGEAVAVG